mmetsp:Transcript_28286/g.85254  ORF Transcript_28286/g.85254 Transcript_28286/m.85254 type:complete len:354 (-) Transcript_28286:2740-3801(-)
MSCSVSFSNSFMASQPHSNSCHFSSVMYNEPSKFFGPMDAAISANRQYMKMWRDFSVPLCVSVANSLTVVMLAGRSSAHKNWLKLKSRVRHSRASFWCSASSAQNDGSTLGHVSSTWARTCLSPSASGASCCWNFGSVPSEWSTITTKTVLSTPSSAMPPAAISFWILAHALSEIFTSACWPRENASAESDTVQYTTNAEHKVSFKIALTASSGSFPEVKNCNSGNTTGSRLRKPGSRKLDRITSVLSAAPASARFWIWAVSVTNCHGLMWIEPWLRAFDPAGLVISNFTKAKVSASAVLAKSTSPSIKIEITADFESLNSAAAASYTLRSTFSIKERLNFVLFFAASMTFGA